MVLLKRKKTLLWLKRLICKIHGHDRVFVNEPRTRIKGKSRGNVRVVDGGYYVCARCEKKLTNWAILSPAVRLYA